MRALVSLFINPGIIIVLPFRHPFMPSFATCSAESIRDFDILNTPPCSGLFIIFVSVNPGLNVETTNFCPEALISFASAREKATTYALVAASVELDGAEPNVT